MTGRKYSDLWTVDWRKTARRVWAEIILDDCFGASAQLAFYFLLAFFPFVVFLAAVTTLVNTIFISVTPQVVNRCEWHGGLDPTSLGRGLPSPGCTCVA